jgi:hypothetical protein
MVAAPLPAALLLGLAFASSVLAQPRPFSCVGAERLEDDVFAIPFDRGRDTIGEAARAPLTAAAELAKAEPERMVCVLGRAADEGGGGAGTNVRLAARRAAAVAAALARLGVERDRIRAESRVAGFSGEQRRPGGAAPPRRDALVVVLPVGD